MGERKDQIQGIQGSRGEGLRRRRLARAIFYFIAAGLVMAGGIVSYLAFEYFSLPDPSEFADRNPEITSFMRIKCADSPCDIKWTPLRDVAPYIPEAILLAEDPRFYSHNGIDWQNVKDAFLANIRHRRIVWGGSSITMQLAKNLYLNPEKSFMRKLKEILLTIKIERSLSKDRILEMYLNTAEWGKNVFGITKAAEYYFQRKPSEMGPLEASFLASILPNPQFSSSDEYMHRFMEVGANIYDKLLGFYLPGEGAVVSKDCDYSLDEEDAKIVDWLIAKMFGYLAPLIKSGDASLFGLDDLREFLSGDELDYIAPLLDEAAAQGDSVELDCKRIFAKDGFAALDQKDELGGERIFWITGDSVGDLKGLLLDAAKDGIFLKVNSSYRADGFQVFTFLVNLREKGYCLSDAMRYVALPGESEHACVDRQAIDFGMAGDRGMISKDSVEYGWLTKNASRYNFHLSYPEDSKSGIAFEPWHWCHNR